MARYRGRARKSRKTKRRSFYTVQRGGIRL